MSVDAEGNAVVVDSPVPQDQPPEPSPEVGRTGTPAADGGESSTTETADPLQELADAADIDRSQLEAFKDADTAKAELTKYLTDKYKRGIELGTQAQSSGGGSPPSLTQPRDDQGRFTQTPPQAPQPNSAPIDFAAVGLNEDDPAAKIIKQLAEQVQAGNARLEQVETRFQETETRAQTAERARTSAEIEQVVDGWNSPDFGSARSQTVFQESARATVKRIAGGLLQSEIDDEGRRVSSVKTLLQQARLIYENSKNPAAPLPKSPGGADIPQSRSGFSQPTNAVAQPGSYNKRLADDPQFLQQLRNRG